MSQGERGAYSLAHPALGKSAEWSPRGAKRCKNAEKTVAGTGPAWAGGGRLSGPVWEDIGTRGAGSGSAPVGVTKRALTGCWRVGRAALGAGSRPYGAKWLLVTLHPYADRRTLLASSLCPQIVQSIPS